jgi:hypothetical protein
MKSSLLTYFFLAYPSSLDAFTPVKTIFFHTLTVKKCQRMCLQKSRIWMAFDQAGITGHSSAPLGSGIGSETVKF